VSEFPSKVRELYPNIPLTTSVAALRGKLADRREQTKPDTNNLRITKRLINLLNVNFANNI
jgi:hypothetical protein